MAIFGFGGAKKLEDIKLNELQDERVRLEVRRDQMMRRIREAQEDYDGHHEVGANMRGLADAELDIIAYKMEQAQRRKTSAESKFQDIMTQIQVVDSVVDVLKMRKDLERKGVWKVINNLKEEELEEQVSKLAGERKDKSLTVNKVSEILGSAGPGDVEVQAHRSSTFRNIRDKLKQERSKTS